MVEPLSLDDPFICLDRRVLFGSQYQAARRTDADPASAAKTLKLLWVSCGDQDGLMGISKGLHTYLRENNVPHIWQVDSGGHTWPV